MDGSGADFCKNHFLTSASLSPSTQKKPYNEKADIWSLGVILVELCQGEPPFLHENPVKALFLISTEDYPKPKSESYSKKVAFSLKLDSA